jgi:signal transduction histidine kinase
MQNDFMVKKMDEIKDMVLNRILLVIMFVMVIGISISLLRLSQTGFKINYAVQIFLALVIVFLYLFRKKINTITKGIIFLGTLYAMALSGLLSFGLYGFGYAYFIPSSAIAFVYFNKKTGWAITLSSLGVILLIGLLFNRGVFEFVPQTTNYMQSLPMWLNMIITVCLIGTVIAMFWNNLFSLLTSTFTHINNQQADMLKMNEQLIVARDKAQESDKLKSSFLANISHEIRTPLNIIIGFSDMLSQTNDAAERAELNQVIRQNSNVMLKIVNDIVDFSKIETNSLALNLTQFNVKDVIESVENDLKHAKPELVDLQIEKIEKLIYADKDRFYQIIYNLLDNALKFTGNGKVHLQCIDDNGRLVFKVIDTGIGIPAEEQARIFDRFYKVDKFTPGPGLGLSLSKSIANLMGGDIQVISQPGTGSTFEFYLTCMN